MKTNGIKKVATVAMAAAMTMGMSATAFAADPIQPYNPTTKIAHDATQESSTDVATVLVSKMLTVNQANKFPTIENFKFQMTPVAAFKNPNVDTDKSGSVTNPENKGGASDTPMPMDSITKKDIPAPQAVDTANEKVVLTGAGTDAWAATIDVGNFLNTENESTYVTVAANKKNPDQTNATKNDLTASTGANAGSVSEAHTDKTRTRITPVDIKYDTAGYYVYEIHELDSEAYDKVPGVFYDDHSYYVVVYVANKTDANGNTIDGVYVHDITAWRNNNVSATNKTDYKPNLTDIAKIVDIHQAGASGDDTLKDNNRGNDATQYQNNPSNKVGENNRTVNQEGNLGKVGHGTNVLPPNFWNDQFTKDILISKNVTGNLADRNKDFEFAVTLTGLEKNHTYTTNVAAAATDLDAALKQTSAGADIMAMPSDLTGTYPAKGTVDGTAKTFTSDADGNATFLIKLKDDERMVINSLPVTATYKVVEIASDHVASLSMTSHVTGEQDKNGAAIPHAKKINTNNAADVTDGTGDGTRINTVDETACATAVETVDMTDGTISMDYINHRELATVTGLGNMIYPAAAAMMVLIAAMAAVMIKRKNNGIEEL